MSPVILFGVVAINLALVAYTIGIIAIARRRTVSAFVLRVFTLAVALDVVATGCMVAGSDKPWFTPHGVVGYLALLVMVVAVTRLWRFSRRGPDAEIPAGLRVFLWIAYVVWFLAYYIGMFLPSQRW